MKYPFWYMYIHTINVLRVHNSQAISLILLIGLVRIKVEFVFKLLQRIIYSAPIYKT